MRTVRQISDELDKLYSELDIVQSMSEESVRLMTVKVNIYPCLMKKSILLKTSLKNRRDIMAGSGTL